MAAAIKPRPLSRRSVAISPNGSIYQRYIGSIADYQRHTLGDEKASGKTLPSRLEPASKKVVRVTPQALGKT